MFRPWEDNIIDNSVINKINNIRVEEKRYHVDLNDVFEYLNTKIYPQNVCTKNQKANFRRQCKSFQIENGQLFYKKTHARVVTNASEQLNIIKMIHCGSDTSVEASALSAHRGRDTTQRLMKERYFWNHMSDDVRDFIMRCDSCQKVNLATLKVVPELKSVEIPKEVFKQIGIDLMSLPEVDGFKYVAVAIDYFSKWSEARPLKDKTAVTVARFIYDEIICRHGCMQIQISDQGREFVNKLNDELFRLTGTKQRVTSAYHPQANGLVERQNRVIKNGLLKVLQDNVLQWPHILQGVLFAHRTAQHSSTGYTPFKMLYQRDATLPIDMHFTEEDKSSSVDNYNQKDLNEDDDSFDVFDQKSFKSTLNKMIVLRNIMEDKAKENLEVAQIRQRYSYSKRHNTGHTFQKGDKVLVRNLYRDDRKGGWRQIPWQGPYEIVSIHSGNTICVLKNEFKILKKKIHIKNLKIYNEPVEKKCIIDEHIENNDSAKSENKLSNDEQENKYDTNKSENNSDNFDKNKVDDSASNHENDLMDVEYIQHIQMNIDRVFNPVNKPWQMKQAKIFNLRVKNFFNYKYQRKNLGKPEEFKTIIGDGNCLFRALSYWITGTEEYHLNIRTLIAEEVKTNKKIINYIGGKYEHKNYLKKNIENNGVWGTETEIIAAALLLNTNIYVYTTQTKNWLLFPKNMDLRKKIMHNEKCIYIRNINNVHFDVVKDVA